jgi:hypothetical protein
VAAWRKNDHSGLCSRKGTNHQIELLFGTSLYDLKIAVMPLPENLMVREGLRLFTPAASLIGIGERFFSRNPVESQVVLASLGDGSDLLRLLLSGGHSAKAGYLAGALRASGRDKLSDEILKTMKGSGYDVRERSPLEAGHVSSKLRPAAAPIVGRLQMLWETTRGHSLPGSQGVSRRPREREHRDRSWPVYDADQSACPTGRLNGTL